MEQLIFELEKKLLKPEIRKSSEELEKLLANDFIEFGSSGKTYNKEEVIESLANEDDSFTFEIDDFKTYQLSENIILATYRLLKKDKETINSLRSSIWKKETSEWKMIFHQGTKIS